MRPLLRRRRGDASAVTRDYVLKLDAARRDGTAAADGLWRQDHHLPRLAEEAVAAIGGALGQEAARPGPARRRCRAAISAGSSSGLRRRSRRGGIPGWRRRCCAAWCAPMAPTSTRCWTMRAAECVGRGLRRRFHRARVGMAERREWARTRRGRAVAPLEARAAHGRRAGACGADGTVGIARRVRLTDSVMAPLGLDPSLGSPARLKGIAPENDRVIWNDSFLHCARTSSRKLAARRRCKTAARYRRQAPSRCPTRLSCRRLPCCPMPGVGVQRPPGLWWGRSGGGKAPSGSALDERASRRCTEPPPGSRRRATRPVRGAVPPRCLRGPARRGSGASPRGRGRG